MFCVERIAKVFTETENSRVPVRGRHARRIGGAGITAAQFTRACTHTFHESVKTAQGSLLVDNSRKSGSRQQQPG